MHEDSQQRMAVFTPAPMFQHISGALNKINKKSAHANDQKMTLCTHRVAATSVVGKCNRVYLRGIESITRTSPLSAVETQLRSKFTAVSRATSTRLKDPAQMASDQAAFKNQNAYKTLRQYVWAAEAAKWEQNNG